MVHEKEMMMWWCVVRGVRWAVLLARSLERGFVEIWQEMARGSFPATRTHNIRQSHFPLFTVQVPSVDFYVRTPPWSIFKEPAISIIDSSVKKKSVSRRAPSCPSTVEVPANSTDVSVNIQHAPSATRGVGRPLIVIPCGHAWPWLPPPRDTRYHIIVLLLLHNQ